MRKTIFKKLEAQGLIANYNRLRKNLPPRLPDRVFIWDGTLKEGVQTSTIFLTYVEKVKLAKMLDETGVSLITVGQPALSEEEKNNTRRIVNEGFHQAKLTAVAGISRTEVDACLECGIREITVTTAVNGLNLQNRIKMTKEQVLQKTAESIEYAKKHGVRINFVLEDASRTPIEDIIGMFKSAVKAGADRLVVEDSVGFLRPLSTRYLLSHIREGLEEAKVKETPMGVHCHNDYGLATANTLAAVEEGASYVSTCVCGFGERSGDAALEEVASVLELLYNMDTGIDLGKIYRIAQLAEKTFASPIQFHKPIVGENSFAHEINDHGEAPLTYPLLYEPFPPQIVGREPQYYFGRTVGRRVIEYRLSEAEIKASPMQIEEIIKRMRRMHESMDKGEAQMTFYQIKRLERDLRKGLTDEDFWRVVEEITRQKPKTKLPEISTPVT